MRKPLRTKDHRRLIRLLRTTRKEAGLTQQVVADRLKVPQSFVAKYEGGERRLGVLEFIDIAKALGVDPVVLLAQLTGTVAPEPALARARRSRRPIES